MSPATSRARQAPVTRSVFAPKWRSTWWTATPQADTVTLDAQGKSTVYLNVDNCAVQLYAQR